MPTLDQDQAAEREAPLRSAAPGAEGAEGGGARIRILNPEITATPIELVPFTLLAGDGGEHDLRAAPEGTLEVPGELGGGPFGLRADGGALAASPPEVALLAGLETALTLVPVRELRLEVRSAGGGPVAGARVQCTGVVARSGSGPPGGTTSSAAERGTLSTTTDPAGRCELGGVLPGATVLVAVSAADHDPLEARLPVPRTDDAGPETVVLELQVSTDDLGVTISLDWDHLDPRLAGRWVLYGLGPRVEGWSTSRFAEVGRASLLEPLHVPDSLASSERWIARMTLESGQGLEADATLLRPAGTWPDSHLALPCGSISPGTLSVEGRPAAQVEWWISSFQDAEAEELPGLQGFKYWLLSCNVSGKGGEDGLEYAFPSAERVQFHALIDRKLPVAREIAPFTTGQDVVIAASELPELVTIDLASEAPLQATARVRSSESNFEFDAPIATGASRHGGRIEVPEDFRALWGGRLNGPWFEIRRGEGELPRSSSVDLSRARPFDLEVVDEEGAPVSATLHLRYAGSDRSAFEARPAMGGALLFKEQPSVEVTTDGQGRARLWAVPGEYRFLVNAAGGLHLGGGYLSAASGDRVLLEEPGSRVSIVLPATRQVFVHVDGENIVWPLTVEDPSGWSSNPFHSSPIYLELTSDAFPARILDGTGTLRAEFPIPFGHEDLSIDVGL